MLKVVGLKKTSVNYHTYDIVVKSVVNAVPCKFGDLYKHTPAHVLRNWRVKKSETIATSCQQL